MSSGWPVGTVTFLFTDVEGSTQRWRSDEAAMAAAMRDHDETLASAIAEAGGVLFKHTGDGVIAAFGSPKAGLAAARAAQEALTLPVRMGLHTGEAELRDGDYFGTTLNRAARVMDAGHGGQVLASSATAALLDGAVAAVDLGLFELKGLDGAERVFQIGETEFPELRARRAQVGNLPRELTEFVGRADEIERVVEEIESAQIVTLFGVGGTGKTRLALEVARSAAGSFADGCWFVELGQVTIPEAVPLAVSNGVGLPAPESGDVVDSLVSRLADRQMLVVVDNCEHVVDVAADVVERIAVGCPRIRVVATSREPLMLRGERVVPVGPLPETDGVALFLERARAESSRLNLDDRQTEAITELCRRLDGLPLAIELAAARVRSMTPVDLLAALDERFRLLVGSRRSRTERHQTMRATLDWSYALCDDDERGVFDRLSVFPAEFDAAAAAAVAGGDDLPSFLVADALARLVDRSLVTTGVGDDGGARFRMLETMRLYGREHLRDSGRSDEIRERHARFVADELTRLSADMLGADEPAIQRQIESHLADAVSALDWFVERGQLDQAMRIPVALILTKGREVDAMMSRIRQAAATHQVDESLAAELALLPPTRFTLTDEEFASNLRLLSPREDRDSFAGAADRRELSAASAEEICEWVRRFETARPLSRYVSLMFGARTLILAGHADEGAEFLDRLEDFAGRTNSEIVATGLLEARGQLARSRGERGNAAALFDEVVQRRRGQFELGNTAILSRFHAIAAHVLAGDRVPPAEVRAAWDAFERSGLTNPSWRAASATAMWLTEAGHRDLAVRFLRWASRLDHNALTLYEDELGLFDLPVAPEGPDESLPALLDELDFV